MSSGFLISEALSEALRRPYHQGDVDVTVSYLVQGLPIGAYRVMLKTNFDTACWVPPVGKRSAHSIYYGDRMVDRTVTFWVKKQGLKLPDMETLKGMAQARLDSKGKKPSSKAGSTATPTPSKLKAIHVLDEKFHWLKDNVSTADWKALLDFIVKAVKSYGRHERQHARETPQNLVQVQKDLKMFGIPFTYFNLFEDARIEHISRQEQGDKFEWLELEDIAPQDNPFNMFLRCIQLEAEPDLEALESEEPFRPGDERTVGIVADSVESYYRRAIACSHAEQLYPIMVEFLREFKEDLPPPPPDPGEGKGKGSGSGSGSGSSGSGKPGEGEGEDGEGGEDEDEGGVEERAGDLSTAAEAASKGDAFFSEFETDTEVVGGTDAEGKSAEGKAKAKLKGDADKDPTKSKGSNAQGIPESVKPTASGGRAQEHEFLARDPGRIDDAFRARVDNLTQMLMRMFKVNNLPAYRESESRRMSGRHLARGEVKYVHKQVFGGKGKRKYSVVFDCSGSMGMDGGRPAREGKLLLLALNNLAKRGFLEGSLILSGYPGGRPGWLQYKFPVKEEIILRIVTNHGHEGLQNSLQENLAHIVGMDDTYVYTDACITDAPINRAFFAARKVWPVGLYVGSEEMATEMDRHFPQNIIRDNIESVVETMLTRNRRTVS